MCEREKATVLSGRIEADDAYLGGENPDGKAGRGSENKVPFVAAVQTNKEGHPIYAVFSPVKTFNNEEIEKWAKQRLAPLKINSDRCSGLLQCGRNLFVSIRRKSQYKAQEY